MGTEPWRATLPDDVLSTLFHELRDTGVPAAGVAKFTNRDWHSLTGVYFQGWGDESPPPVWTASEMPSEWAAILRKASPCPSTPRSSWTNPLPVWLSPEPGNERDVTYCTFCYPHGSNAAAAGDIALLNRYDVYTHEKCNMHKDRLRAQQQVGAAAPAAAAVPLDADTTARLAELELEVQTLRTSVEHIREQLAKSMETMEGTITKLTASIPKAVNDALFGAEEQNRDQSGSASSKKLKYAAGGGNI